MKNRFLHQCLSHMRYVKIEMSVLDFWFHQLIKKQSSNHQFKFVVELADKFYESISAKPMSRTRSMAHGLLVKARIAGFLYIACLLLVF
jgi:hypothetical protein